MVLTYVIVYENPVKRVHCSCTGDIVGVLSGNTHISGQKISGVVIRSTSSHISVVVDDLSVTVDLSAHDGTIQLVKLANDVTYRRIRRYVHT